MLGYSRDRDILHNKRPDFLDVVKHVKTLTGIRDRSDLRHVGQLASQLR